LGPVGKTKTRFGDSRISSKTSLPKIRMRKRKRGKRPWTKKKRKGNIPLVQASISRNIGCQQKKINRILFSP